MDRDRVQSLNKLRREIDGLKREVGQSQSSTSSIRRSLHAAVTVGNKGKASKNPPSSSTGHQRAATMSPHASAMATNVPQVMEHDIDLVMQSLNRKWDGEVARLRRYLFRNYNLVHGLNDGSGEYDNDDAKSDGRPNTAASLGTMLDNLKLEVSVSADEVPELQSGTAPSTATGADDLEASPKSHLDSFQGLDSETSGTMDPRQHPETAPFQEHSPPQVYPSDYAGAPSTRLGVPVPAIPSTTDKPGSVRSARSSSIISSSTSTAASARSSYGTASSSLRGFLSGNASKERRRIEKMRPAPVCVSNDKPPQLDWAPPKLELRDFR